MKALSKILVPTIVSMAFVAPAGAQQLLKADPSQTYPEIRKCLVKLGLVENEDFRLQPGTPEKGGVVDLRGGFFEDPLWRGKQQVVAKCWKKQ